ncbi:MAG: TAXI family TRAP transporter solute-binding subunit [Betaproteobacteria bacterium]|nr:TAXI family TRAP transporter solute-binding subunit [Betaproteobacteria bacterium]
MKRSRPFRWLAALIVAGGLIPLRASPPAPQFLTVATGGITGVYYTAGEALCTALEKSRARHGLRCAVESTPAAVHNLIALRRGDVQFAFAQADTEFAAARGIEEFRAATPDTRLRAVAALHLEWMTIVVRRGSATRVEDLLGKRVSFGAAQSGTRHSASVLLRAMGKRLADFGGVMPLKTDELADALCQGRIDGYLYQVGHPARLIGESTARCAVTLLPVGTARIDALTRDYSYYVPGAIPGGLYAGNPKPVPTYGARAVLLTRMDVPDHVVYELTRALHEDLANVRAAHPALAGLSPMQMAQGGAVVPLHDGAQRFYRERGLH